MPLNLQKLIEYTQNILTIQGITDSLSHCTTFDEYHSELFKIYNNAETIAYIQQNFYGATERKNDIIT